jgi:multiple sugar transport system substrate-binding protein
MDGTWRKATRRAHVQALGALSALGAGVALATCAQGTATEGTGPVSVKGPAKVELGHYFAQGPRWDLIQSSARRFQEEHPNLTVETQPVTGNYWEALITRLAGGTAPDICIGSGATFLGLLEKNSWQQVDAYLRRDKSVDLKAYYSQPEIFDKDGKHYGLPFMINTTLLYYNKSLFQRSGVPEPTERWTWDDMLDAARKLTRADGSQWGVNVGTGFEGQLLTFIWSAGGDYINKERTRTTLDEPGSLEGLQWVADLFLRHRVAPPVGTRFTPDDFASGQVALRTGITAAIGSTYEPLIGSNFEWEIAWRPKHPKTGKRAGSFNANPFMLLNPQLTNGKNADAGWLLLRHMAGPYVQGLIGQTRIQMPTLISAAQDKSAFGRPPPQNMHLNHELMASSEPLRFHKTWLDWYNAITEAIAPLFRGEMGAKEAALAANVKGDAILRGS